MLKMNYPRRVHLGLTIKVTLIPVMGYILLNVAVIPSSLVSRVEYVFLDACPINDKLSESEWI